MEDSILYSCIHKKLCNKVSCTRLMRKRDLYMFLTVNYKIPKKLIPPIIKEMELLGILEDLNQRQVKIMPINIDVEEEANKIYVKMGLF